MFHAKPAFASEREISVPASLFSVLLLVFIVATRWALAPKYLYYFDSANFALALDHFDPALHQPQPPGYPLFVGLIRLIHFFVASPERVLVIAGLVAACAATLLIRVLAAEMFSPAAGVLSAALLASNPVFWFGGLTNQVRLFLSLAAIAVALLAWRAISRPGQPIWLYATFGALGIAGGFRPVDAVLLVPIVLWTCWRCKAGPRTLSAGALAVAATSLPWIAVTLLAVGGPARMLAIVQDYAHSQFRGSSVIYGANALPAWHMFQSAVAWTVFGILAWIWAVPFLGRRIIERDRLTFLAIAFLPPFLFSAFVHIGDPDQGLASMSILAVVGGAVMSAFLRQVGSSRVYTAAAALVAVNSLLFFVPPYRLARASSYRAVEAVDRMTTDAVGALRQFSQDGPVTILHYGSLVASRQLEYYFPEAYVNVLPGSPGHPIAGGTPVVFYRHSSLPAANGAAGLIRAGSRRLLCLVPPNADPGEFRGWTRHGPLFVLDKIPKEGIQLGPYHLTIMQ